MLSQQILRRFQKSITQAHIDAYKRDGAVCIRQILTPT